jgi:hypothetical protein
MLVAIFVIPLCHMSEENQLCGKKTLKVFKGDDVRNNSTFIGQVLAQSPKK